MERPQRLAMNHQRDGDIVRAADAVEMVLDVADDEAGLVVVAEVIDHLELFGCQGRLGRRAGAGGREGGAKNGGRGPQDAASMHGVPPDIPSYSCRSSASRCF